MNTDFEFLRRAWLHDKALDCLKVALAFSGVLAVCFGMGHEDWLVNLLLGVIACALAETPDRFGGRFRALVVTLLCFAFVAFSVRWLYPYPWLFVLGLASSTLCFVMLGALGERYAAIAVASIILAIYTMLSLSQRDLPTGHDWQGPALLLIGAGWYGAISLLGALLFAIRPARQIVAQTFEALGAYLTLKADLLEPQSGREVDAQRIALATQNGRLVGLMNRARQILLIWTQGERAARRSAALLQWYFLAQEIHERTSSAHYPYQALAEAFARSDILFRCQSLMRAQAEACHALAAAILSARTFDPGERGRAVRHELEAALAHLQTLPHRVDAELLDSVADLCRNISAIEALLATAGEPAAASLQRDRSLRDHNPKTLTEMWQRLRAQVSPPSKRFRHGVRLAVALAAGYGLLHAFALPQGYWVLLTTVFVCQPSFSTTWQRLSERVFGTVLGLCGASLFISAFPHPTAQLALLLACGVAFFALRTDRYMAATASITVLVMICFNQFGSSYAVIMPRLLDTLIGSALAALAVAFILPDWQGRQVHHAMACAVAQAERYLGIVLAQYRQGKNDDLTYRIVRREAHNADAELSSTLVAMLTEPGRYRLAPEPAFRFLCASHTLLGYVSALGAHREKVGEWLPDSQIAHAERRIRASLQRIAAALDAHSLPDGHANATTLTEPSLTDADTEIERRIVRQLSLIELLLPELTELTASFATERLPAR